VRKWIVALVVMFAFVERQAPRLPARWTGGGACPSTKMRVVVAGDSVAHGEGDESRLGFAGHLDRELTRLGIAHQATIDLAISGSRTWQLARALAQTRSRALVAKADAIVLSIGGNDLYGDSRARVSVITIADLFVARRRISPIDGFHPNADAYERIARRVAEAM